MLDMWRRSIEATIHLITDHKSHSIEREMRPEIDGDKFSWKYILLASRWAYGSPSWNKTKST